MTPATTPAKYQPTGYTRNDVRAVREQLAGDMRVVGAEVMLLRVSVTQIGARLEEELDDFDVGRHLARAHGRDVVELRAVAEDPREERIEEAAFELARRLRLAQAQAGENFQLNRPSAKRAPIELIYQRHGVAECERHCQHDALADTPERGVDTITDILELLKHEKILERYTKYRGMTTMKNTRNNTRKISLSFPKIRTCLFWGGQDPGQHENVLTIHYKIIGKAHIATKWLVRV